MNTHRIEENGFRLVEQLDDTSRTIVWKAVQRTLDRTVIIQVLKPEVSSDASEVDRFLTTARLFARIKSDSIAAVFDIVSEGDLHYVVMEHVDGPTLQELVNTHGPLPMEQVLRIAASLINSLEQMWASAHIVHRNLKSATIRVDSRGVAKITDFSLAIAAGAGVDATAMDGGHIVGTPCFLSPEQAQGSHTLYTQSDMYALGAVLYHLTTGKVPFEHYDVLAILSAHVKEQILPPHHVNRHIPATFSWFVHRLMMKNPNNRYAEWNHVLRDIRLMLAGEEPSCVRPDEEYLSTIAKAFEDADTDDDAPIDDIQEAPRVRLNRKEKNDEIAAYQDKHLVNGHAHEIRRADLIWSTICWGILVCWLALVFWFRAVYQSEYPEHADKPSPLSHLSDAMSQISESLDDLKLLPGKGDDAPAVAPVPPDQEPAPQPAPPQTSLIEKDEPRPPVPPQQTSGPEAAPAGIPTPIIQGLALALANSDLVAARQLVRNAPERFQEKEALQALLDQTADPDTLVADYLRSQIGKPLLFEHNGKQRTVIPRSIENGIVQLEANGRGAEFPIDKLTADEKLRWMAKPQSAEHCAAYCITLLHSARRDEIPYRATDCPLLLAAFIQALEIAPAVTPPAE